MSFLNEKRARERIRLGNRYLLSVTEVARLLGMSRTAVQKKIDGNEMEAHKIGETFIVILPYLEYQKLKQIYNKKRDKFLSSKNISTNQ